MKLMIASDIHGCKKCCEKMLLAYEREKADQLILLGDLLYHGPRNGVPEDYDPASVIDQLNSVRTDLLCIRGNCDSEVDQMVLEFPILSEFAVLYAFGRRFYLTHGHVYNEKCPPKVSKGDIVLSGHTHIPVYSIHDDVVFINPGSVSIPKGGSRRSYLTIEEKAFIWKELSGEEYMRFALR